MSLEQFANQAASTIVGNMDVGSGPFTVTVANPSTFPVIPQFRVAIDTQIFLVTGVAGNVFTMVPWENSPQASHSDGAPIRLVMTAGIMHAIYPRGVVLQNFSGYTMTKGDMGVAMNPSGTPAPFVITLPPVASADPSLNVVPFKNFTVEDIAGFLSTTNTVTLRTPDATWAGGGQDVVMQVALQSLTFRWNTVNWSIIA